MVGQREIDKFLSSLEYQDLKLVKSSVEARIQGAEAEAKQSAKEQLEKRAEELGFSVSDLWDLTGGRRRGGANGGGKGKLTGPPKFRNPKDQSETWSGRGRKAEWVMRELGVSATDKVDPKKMEKYINPDWRAANE